MRIERLDALLVNVPLRTEQRTSFSTSRTMTQCLVRASADDGRVGWGEASGGAGGWAPAYLEVGLGINDYAALHVLAVAPGAVDGHQFMASHLADDVLAGGPLIPDGRPLRVPDTPGLGAPVSKAKVGELHERFRTEGNATAFAPAKGDTP